MNESTQLISFYCSIENTGFLDISRYDVANRTVYGTFSCRAVNRDESNDIIEITEGRFDIEWDTLDETVFP